MTREELIKSLTLLKEQARNSGGNTFVGDINIDSFNFVIDSAIEALEQVPKLQNRCAVLTHGYLCAFCPYECEHKAESESQESEG